MEKENVNEIFKKLDTSINGIDENEANRRLEKYGYNEITEKKGNIPLKFIKKFYGPIPFMLEIAFIVTFLLNELINAYVILALLVFNSIVGFIEEYKADNSIELLKKRLKVKAKVLRKEWCVIDATKLVPGDIVKIKIGDIVPADMVVIKSEGIKADQSILTGESLPVKKSTSEKLFSGSKITSGEGICVVVSTGYNTYYGKTAKLVEEAKPQLHLQNFIISITKRLVFLDILLVILLSIFAILVFNYSLLSLLPFAIIIIIASVPVSLPTAFTVTMALGTEKMADKSVLITKLDAIEEASAIDVICFDKTGTITENKLEVEEIFALNGSNENEVVETAALCSRKEDNDSIDNAILKYAAGMKLSTEKYKIEKFTPFEPSTKEASAIISFNKKRFEARKGATNEIIKYCKINNKQKEIIFKKIEEFSKKNLRTLLVSKSEGEKHRLLGIIALYDKPRKDAKRLVKDLESLGIKAKMLTGDNVNVAKEIAEEVEIKGNVIDARNLKGKSIEQIKDVVNDTSIFAEIYPEDKYMIVKALQASGHRVGMTGDGINDAPALKQAEVGIAVENATDIAKNVSAVVLEKDGIDVIIDAIKESRKIFERMTTYTIVKITRVIQILFFILITFMAFGFMPILPFELILLIFTNDIVNISISTDNTSYSQKPTIQNAPAMINISILLGIGMLAVTILFIPIAEIFSNTAIEFATFSFLVLNITDNILLYSVRSRSKFLGLFPNYKLLVPSIGSVVFAITLAYFGILVSRISALEIITLVIASIILMVIFNLIKDKIFKKFVILNT